MQECFIKQLFQNLVSTLKLDGQTALVSDMSLQLHIDFVLMAGNRIFRVLLHTDIVNLAFNLNGNAFLYLVEVQISFTLLRLWISKSFHWKWKSHWWLLNRSYALLTFQKCARFVWWHERWTSPELLPYWVLYHFLFLAIHLVKCLCSQFFSVFLF